MLFIGVSALTGLQSAAGPFQNLLRKPDAVTVLTESDRITLEPGTEGTWGAGRIRLKTFAGNQGLEIKLTAPEVAIKHLELRWHGEFPADEKYLGDAWERAYGDLEWRELDSRRVMPWYFLASDGHVTHGYGVKTGPAALCHWTVATNGVTLHADVRSGGVGVRLNQRTLEVCTVMAREGQPGESSFAAAQSFCRQMCPHPRLPPQPVYGFNDWYCAYGGGTAAAFFTNAAYIVSLAPATNPPFAVVDDGWQVKRERNGNEPWLRTNPRFSPTLTMGEFAEQVRALGARPGIWVRPLQAYPDQPANWRLTRDTNCLDPTVPEVRAYVRKTIQRLHEWQFDLIKHDFTTFEITGRWGKDMLDSMTADGWSFADRHRTTAEVVRDLYHDIREAAGAGTVIIGCNTIGHLAAGIFEVQRIGDDTSGREWERTRKMGVNCLAFRAPQHNAFFAVDADCVGQADSGGVVPWEKNRQWLDLLSRSGSPFFVSFSRATVSPQHDEVLRAALAAAARTAPVAVPVDWMESRLPARWRFGGSDTRFTW
jgi:alpha-galactosidase